MTRKPAHIEAQLRVRVPRGYQGVWEIIRGIPREYAFSVAEVVEYSNSSLSVIQQYIRSLELAGYLERAGKNDQGGILFRCAKPFGKVAPRLRRDGTPAQETGRGQENMWRTIKMLKHFSPAEVAVHASTEETQVSVRAAESYLKHLVHAGYIKRERGDQVRYRMAPSGDTGPLAPQVMRTKFIFDPNLKEVRGSGMNAQKVTP
ncbi:MAG: hypothetical protein H7839_08930 [Magnetococcus sp. YQC-5]